MPTNETAKFVVSVDAKAIGLMIDEIGILRKSIITNIQVVAVSCALHAALHGDITLMARLDATLAEGFNRSTLRKWATTHGPFDWQRADKDAGIEKSGFVYNSVKAEAMKMAYQADHITLITKLTLEPWEKAKAAGSEDPDFDFDKALKTLVARAKRYQADPEKSKHPKVKIDAQRVKALERLLETGSAALH